MSFRNKKLPFSKKDAPMQPPPNLSPKEILRLQRENDRMRKEIAQQWRLIDGLMRNDGGLSIIAVDRIQIIRFWSAGAEAIFGYRPHEIVGKRKIDILFTGQPQAHAALEEACNRLYHSKKSVSCEVVQKASNGKDVWIKLSLLPLFDECGKVDGIIFIGQDITETKQTEKRLEYSLRKLRRAVGGTIHAMALTVEKRDPYTAGHQIRTTDLARAIADEMGLSKDNVDAIRMAGVIHDLGKLSVPAEILNKPGKLTSDEFTLIKRHSEAAYDILKYVEFPWPIAQIVLQHHERMNGSGYPHGLKGENICIEARIIAVADVVESMASHRPYRPALGIDKALEEIEQNRSKLYEPAAVDACLRLFREKSYTLIKDKSGIGLGG